MDIYLIPANAKKSQLWFGVFRPVDMGVFATGAALTLILMFAISSFETWALFVKLIPVGIATFLVMPVPNYHNVLVFLRELYRFYMNRRVYLWKGWCVVSESEKEK